MTTPPSHSPRTPENRDFPLMPADLEAEKQVLACILTNPRLILKVEGVLKAEHFYTAEHGTIYACMLHLFREQKEPHVFNVAAELVRREKRPDEVQEVRAQLREIKDAFAISARIEDYRDAIIETSKFRRGIAACATLTQALYYREKDALTRAVETFSQIALDSDVQTFAPFSEALSAYLARYEVIRQNWQEGKRYGLSTGFRSLDRFFCFYPDELIVLAARTSVGKTSLALNIALNIAKAALAGGSEVAFFSLEMSQHQLVQRLLSMETLIDQTMLRDGSTTEEEHALLYAKAEHLRPIGLHISDRARSLEEIKTGARVICAKRPIGVLMVDYLGLIRLEEQGKRNRPRHEELAEISRELKGLAQQLHVPILALAQVNRAGERQEDLQLSHLSESDAISRDADTVAFLQISPEEMEKRNRAQDYNITFLVRKNRQGPLGEVLLGFRPWQTRFCDILETEDERMRQEEREKEEEEDAAEE